MMSEETRPLRARDESGTVVTVMAERKVVNTAAGLCHWPWVYWVAAPEGKKWATRQTDGRLVVVSREKVYCLTLEEEASFEGEDVVFDSRSNASDEQAGYR